MGRAFFSSWLDLLLVCATLVTTGQATVVPFLEPGFFFDYNVPAQRLQIPVTQQCETIHLKWGRQGATGANPVAPYSFSVYTSVSTVPLSIAAGPDLSFDWPVPFAPGTMYQICMWDKNGLTGGCQSTYTVIQNTTVDFPNCQNVTFPQELDVEATVPGGPMSRFGFIDQCTDLSVTPKAGKPPYTLTVAPALHPPFNITSKTKGPIVWTVSLPRAFPFFLSMTSADGLMWSNGPLHAGALGPTDCLSPGSIPKAKANMLVVASGVGGSLGAAIIAALAVFLFFRFRRRKTLERPVQVVLKHESLASTGSKASPTDTSPTESYNSFARQTLTSDHVITSPLQRTDSAATASSPLAQSGSRPSRSRTYVLHHDAGRAPVTVVIPEETEVVELPPRYQNQNSNGLPNPAYLEKGDVAGPSNWQSGTAV
ncbi:hypothetical protein C8J57DRAFT_1347223 [Mycena rebaudengoi]|nr:hypothetical protein C8J57DRAFT_1347223 [Mycena rebaudengoi]